MALKFIKGAHKADLNMVKVDIDGNEVWAECSSAVKNFAKSNFKEGQEVEFKYDENVVNGKKKYKIDGYIKALGGAEPPSDTGKISSSGGYSGSSYGSDKNISIRSQAIGKMVAQSLVSLQGHVDPNNIKDVIEEIYKVYDNMIK